MWNVKNNTFQAMTIDAIPTFVDNMDYEIPAGVAVRVRQISDDEFEIEDLKTGATAFLFDADLPFHIEMVRVNGVLITEFLPVI